MKTKLGLWRIVAAMLALAFAGTGLMVPQPAFAGTTGTILGTVTDASTHAPVADVKVTASSPSGNYSTTTDAKGFYSLQSLIPDTYTISFQANGYEPVSSPGITAQQDLPVTINQTLSRTLKTIASVRASGSSNLVKANVTTDVYTVSGQQLTAISGGDNLHKTLYQYMQALPGVTADGYPAQPRIRGGQVNDLGYEFDGIPIQDRITGFFTTNLSSVGIGNVEVFTGGLTAENAANGTGVINTVVKTGTYPSFGDVSFGVTSPDQNNYTTLEYGGMTPNRKFSYYLSGDIVNSRNQYLYGQPTFLCVLLCGLDGPGTVKTRDFIGNFHYRPDAKNDFQFLIQNGLGEFNFDYLLARGPGQPPLLSVAPCSGNVPTATSPNGMGGGTAPNGQSCPAGLYFGSVSPGAGNIWHHYSGIGKIQWNHNINENSFFSLRFAENFNQYIFDQPLSDPNIPSLENPGDPYNISPSCPSYPYAVGQPVAVSSTGHECARNVESFYGDRRSNMWIGALDYTNDINANTQLKLGIGNEHDNNIFSYYLTNYFNASWCGTSGTWPCNYLKSNYPTTIPYAYIDPTFHVGRFVLEPGLRWQSEHYGFPGGGASVSVLNPTFAGTYTFDPKNVVRFSYGNTSSFVGSGYVYRSGSSFYTPNQPGASANPQKNISSDLMWEHAFSPDTTMRVGPWYESTSNYYEFYQPYLGTYTSGPNKGAAHYGPAVPGNAGQNHAFGFEFALDHVDHRPVGISYWLSATLDNYWTTSGVTIGFINFPEPTNIVNEGILLRNPNDPIFSASLTADMHSGRFRLLPFIYYQEGAFYNVGQTSTLLNGNKVPPYISQPERISSAYWQMNATLLEHLGPSEKTDLGIRVTNLFNNNSPPQPCYSGGTGCGAFFGPQSGVVGQKGYIYQQTFSQNPMELEFFIEQKM